MNKCKKHVKGNVIVLFIHMMMDDGFYIEG